MCGTCRVVFVRNVTFKNYFQYEKALYGFFGVCRKMCGVYVYTFLKWLKMWKVYMWINCPGFLHCTLLTSGLAFIYFMYVKSQNWHPEKFYKNSVLKNSTKFTGKHLRRGLFCNKTAGWRPATSLKTESGTGSILQTPARTCLWIVGYLLEFLSVKF